MADGKLTDNQLYCSNLPWSVKTADLKRAFAEHGEISDCFVAFRGRRSRGFGFVLFADSEGAEKALAAMDGVSMGEGDGQRTISVVRARAREKEWVPPENKDGPRKTNTRANGGKGGKGGKGRARKDKKNEKPAEAEKAEQGVEAAKPMTGGQGTGKAEGKKKSGKKASGRGKPNQKLGPKRERTYIMIKPDGVQRGLCGNIVKRFEAKGFKMVALKLCAPPKELIEKHYDDLKTKKFFPSLVEYMCSGPVCCMVWEGDNVVATGRKLLGATMPKDSNPGTIRGDLCTDVGRNICHGSDSVESAEHEIKMWFKREEMSMWAATQSAWVYEPSE